MDNSLIREQINRYLESANYRGNKDALPLVEDNDTSLTHFQHDMLSKCKARLNSLLQKKIATAVGKVPDIYIAFSKGELLQAHSMLFDDENYAIVINIGCVFAIQNMIADMLYHHPNVIWDLEQHTQIPETQQVCAAILSNAVLDFIFFHELSHILNGHLRYKKELATRSNDKIIKQTLEFDADSQAIVYLVGTTLDAYFTGRLKATIPESSYNLLFGSSERLISTIQTAIYIFLRIYIIDDNTEDSIMVLSHPPFAMRLFGCLDVAAQKFSMHSIISDYPIEITTGNIVKNVEQAFLKIGFPIETQDFVEAVKNALELFPAHHDRISKHYAEIYPDLNRLKHCGKLAVPQF
ncbi:MAG: hypothetical protein LW855_00225 [Alphaproteobacteria bacterium]|jgi:hypothetical protein|nr:hypothetical protein [Thalassospira sp.]MCE2964209.1 hypothetical protein [Alphaproteobacteria bacterium]